MTEVDYNALGVKNPRSKAEQPYRPPTRALNTALHGAGSVVDSGQHQTPPLHKSDEHAQARQAASASATGRDEFGRSVKAVAWLRDILTARQLPEGRDVAKALAMLEDGRMNQKQVSAAIDAFKDCPRKGAQRAEAKPETDLDRVVAFLQDREARGTINLFGQSLLSQFRSRGTLSERQVGAILRGMPSKPEKAPEEAPEPLPVVPDGRYAVDSAAGELTFYRVKVRTQRTYIHLKYGPNEGEVPFTWEGYRTILQSIIDAGPYEAALRYAHELGRCSVCDLDLTNRLSRELGIGPVCGGRFHDADDWKAIKADARAVIRARGEDPNEAIA